MVSKKYWCYAVVGLGLALRLYQLNANSLWEDEIFTAIQTRLPVGELWRWTAGDIHPPGYYLLVGGLAGLAGWGGWQPSALTDWLWRWPSVLAGTLAIALTYRLGADWLGGRVGLTGALLLAVSPVAVQYSQEARMHELFLLGAALSTWALARALAHPQRWRWWLAYALATAANLYIVYLAFLVLAAQAVWVGSFRDLRFLRWFASAVMAFILYLPWWPVVVSMIAQHAAVQPVYDAAREPLGFVVRAIGSLGPGDGWPSWAFLALWAAGMIGLARRLPALALFGASWLVLPLVAPLVLHDPRSAHMRYAFLLPVYLLGVAQGVWSTKAFGSRKTRNKAKDNVLFRGLSRLSPALAGRPGCSKRLVIQTALPVALAVLLVAASGLQLAATYRQAKPDWRGAGAYLAAHTRPGDVIVTDPLFDTGRYLDYYYTGPAELTTPAMLVSSLPARATSMRASGGRVWAVTRFQPAPVAAIRSVEFAGLTVSEPAFPVYDPDVLTAAMIELMQQAVAAAPDWAARTAAEGIAEPDPLVTRAAAYLFLGDVYRAAGQLPRAIGAYRAMLADYPASADGYVTLAEAYQAAGQLESAARAYRQAMALQPDWQGPAADAAGRLVDAGRWAEAVAAYQSIVRQR